MVPGFPGVPSHLLPGIHSSEHTRTRERNIPMTSKKNRSEQLVRPGALIIDMMDDHCRWCPVSPGVPSHLLPVVEDP